MDLVYRDWCLFGIRVDLGSWRLVVARQCLLEMGVEVGGFMGGGTWQCMTWVGAQRGVLWLLKGGLRIRKERCLTFNYICLLQVLEIRPSIKWDKGKALEFLLESLGRF